MPVSKPVDGFMVAFVISLLVHVPPPVPYSVVVAPTQTLNTPDIAPGVRFTVSTAVTLQPDGRMKLMTAIPPEMPVTVPSVASMLAVE